MTTYTRHPTYTIREASLQSGLPESTLRYYETIGLIHPIHRDSSSKHRVYLEQDINFATAVACLSATGMSLDDMRTYLRNRGKGAESAQEQIELLEAQQVRLADEARFLAVRQRYVDAKIAYWAAVRDGDDAEIERAREYSQRMVGELKAARTAHNSPDSERPAMMTNGAIESVATR